MDKNANCSWVLDSGPVDLHTDPNHSIFPELFAFLSPTGVEVPPLRQRIEDLETIISSVSVNRVNSAILKRFEPAAFDALRHYHWPGNTAELSRVMTFVYRKRPTGQIRIEDLPPVFETLKQNGVVAILKSIGNRHGFRILTKEDGIRDMLAFLKAHRSLEFKIRDFQSKFMLGPETTRRLLRSLECEGLIRGIKGAQGRRTTRYAVTDADSRS
jgi:DNA-binding NtrC family response regulator